MHNHCANPDTNSIKIIIAHPGLDGPSLEKLELGNVNIDNPRVI